MGCLKKSNTFYDSQVIALPKSPMLQLFKKAHLWVYNTEVLSENEAGNLFCLNNSGQENIAKAYFSRLVETISGLEI